MRDTVPGFASRTILGNNSSGRGKIDNVCTLGGASGARGKHSKRREAHMHYRAILTDGRTKSVNRAPGERGPLSAPRPRAAHCVLFSMAFIFIFGFRDKKKKKMKRLELSPWSINRSFRRRRRVVRHNNNNNGRLHCHCHDRIRWTPPSCYYRLIPRFKTFRNISRSSRDLYDNNMRWYRIVYSRDIIIVYTIPRSSGTRSIINPT